MTSQYELVVHSEGGRQEERGLGPERMTMHEFDAFRCTTRGTRAAHAFYVELGPECRVLVRAQSHLRDTGRSSSESFIQAEGVLAEGHECNLPLDGGRTIAGMVKSGVIVIRPASTTLDLALDVPNGTLRLTMSGSWEGERRTPSDQLAR